MPARISTGAVIIVVGCLLTFFPFWNGIPLLLTVMTIGVLICFELSNMMDQKGYRFYLWINSIAVTLSFLNFFLYGIHNDSSFFIKIELSILTLLTLIILLIESTSGDFSSSLENIGGSIFGFIMVGMFFPMIVLIKMMDLSGWILAIFLSITWMSDAGGLLFGKLFGKHRIEKLSSPNKTVEGYIGTFVVGFLVAAGFFIGQNIFALSTRLNIVQMIILALCVIAASIIGDIGESTIKRWANAKDSGNFLPGHGGFFDRFDSVIFAAPVFYILMKLFGY